MKPLSLFLFALLCGFISHAQVLEIEHLTVLADTIPFKFSGSAVAKDYSRYREIRIGCLNTGNADLIFTSAKQSFTNDTVWLKAADNVKFPNVIKPGAYGTISITYSVFSPFQRIQINSNSRTGPQVITILDNYKEAITFRREMKDYPAKLKEGETAHFASTIENNSKKNVIIDSVSISDPSLVLETKLPLTIPAGKSVGITLTATTAGKMNFYYGGSPLFFYHPENGFEDFAKQEFSCVIIPNITLQDKDTFEFGTVKRGTIVTGTFHFVNNGTFTLESGKNKSECVTFDKEKIAPGQSFTVTVKYNTTLADSGRVKREFPILLPPFFYSNTVYIVGMVKGPSVRRDELLIADQQKKDCGTVSNDTVKTLKRDFRMQNNTGLPIVVSGVTTGDGAYGFCDKKTAIAPGEYFIVTFVYNAKKVGTFERTVTIAYTPGDCSTGEFYYMLTIKGNVISK